MFESMSLQFVIDSMSGSIGLYGLFSPPGFGKTSLMMYFAHTLSVSGFKCLVFSLELSRERWLERMHKLRMNTDHIVIDDTVGLDINRIRKVICEEKPQMVLVDYLGLLDDECAALVGLKNIAHESSTSVLASADLGRSSGDRDPFNRRPELYDLTYLRSGKGTIDELHKAIDSMDLILFLHRHHDCERGIGYAHRYNLSNAAELIIKKGYTSLRDLPDSCCFDMRVLIGRENEVSFV